METLQRLTRRQVDALGVIADRETPDRGVPLKAIASNLRIQPPSALTHLTPLEDLGLITRHRGKSRLTEKGRRTLVEYQRHHRITENLFSQLGLSSEEVHAAALEVDLSISHETVQRLCKAQGHPIQCPHGHPIPPCKFRLTEG